MNKNGGNRPVATIFINLECPIWNVEFQNQIENSTFDIRHSTFHISHFTFDIRHSTFHIPHEFIFLMI